MATGKPVSLVEAFSVITGPRVAKRSTHDLVEMLVVAVDGKTSRRSGGGERRALHLVSALATGIGVALGQEATSNKSNEITAIPPLLRTLAIRGAIVTIDAAGTHAPIAQVIQDQGPDYVLAVKDNQPLLAGSIREFFATGQAAGWARVPYDYYETVEKDHGRIEVRRYFAFGQLECLANPDQWPGLTMFGVVQSERTLKGKTSLEERLYIGSIPVQARKFAHAVRSHWEVENRLHWCLDVCLNDDQARARVRNSARNLATVRRMALNILRLDKSRKGGIKTRRMLAGTSDHYREQLLGLVAI